MAAVDDRKRPPAAATAERGLVSPVGWPASGRYAWKPPKRGATGVPVGGAPAGVRPVRKETVSLDVDGRYPQLAASGTIRGVPGGRIHWVARLRKLGPSRWKGPVWFREAAPGAFPYTTVDVVATRAKRPSARRLKVTFSGGGVPRRSVTCRFVSPAFRTVSFEFDFQKGIAADTEIDTAAHPVRPASLPAEKLSIEAVFRRAGCAVSTTPGGSVPAPPGATWSDMELHDAMQRHWSRFASRAQWAMWVFFAKRHEMGPDLGGLMFDAIGPNHRQGTALFVDSFIAQPPPGDPKPAAWVDRMRFWTAVHEMGHGFNLAHSWQKSLGHGWVPLADEPEARSFMNYPYAVAGGQAKFFASFEYRFSNRELLFIRHAPERFVQMGNAAWFDRHGFEDAAVLDEPTFGLELRVNREVPSFEFLEPVWLELKLTNVSSEPRRVDPDVLDLDALTVVVKREGREARRLVPFRQKCLRPAPVELAPGESLFGTVLASAGLGGWDVADPGAYVVQAMARVGEEDVVSNPLALEIAPPASREDEHVAGDLLTDEAARVLVFGGSRFLERGNDALREAVDRLPERRIALHARVALGSPLTIDFKDVVPAGEQTAVTVTPAEPEAAAGLMEPALVERAEEAAESFGHVRFRATAERVAGRLAAAGAEDEALATLDSAIETLGRRRVHGKPVKASVLAELEDARKALSGGRRRKGARPGP